MTRAPDLLHQQGAPMHRQLRPLSPLLVFALATACAGDASMPAEVPSDAATLDVRGAPTAPARLTISPTSANFTPTTPLRPGQSATVTFTVTNLGGRTAPLSISLDGEDFTKVTDGCNRIRLNKKRSCQVTVTFAPARASDFTGILEVFEESTFIVSATLSGTSAWEVNSIEGNIEFVNGQWSAVCQYRYSSFEFVVGMPVSAGVSGGPSEPFEIGGITDSNGLLIVPFPTPAQEGSYQLKCSYPGGDQIFNRDVAFPPVDD